MDHKSIIDLISKVDLFRGLPPQIIPTIADQLKPVRYKPQEIVIKQDQKVQNLYIVAKGRLEEYAKNHRGGHTHISYLLPKDYFGALYLLHAQPSTTEIMALEDSECLCLPEENFLSLLEWDPEISQHMLRSILKRVHRTSIIEEAAKYKEKAIQFLQQNKRIVQYTKITGKSVAIHDLNEAIEKVAQHDAPVLIEGEFGTGKELIARIIHSKSKRSMNPFLSVDCEKLIPDTMEMQLFGEQFFRSRQSGMGMSYMELAEGGTLLLKNIEVLPIEIQVKMHAIFYADKERGQKATQYLPDVRIMATSRVKLESRAVNGQFDQKFFQLLSAHKINVPSLRERKKDIPPLVDHFIKKYAKYYQKKVDKVSEAAMKRLLDHDYKLSNVQELEEIIERAVTLTRSDTVRSEHIFLGLPATTPLVLFNILKWKFFTSWVKKRIFPEKIRELVAIVFLLIIGMSLFSHQLPYPYNQIGKVLTWSVWWPAMFLSFFIIGRFWCSICPYATYSRIGKKMINLELNFPFKKYDYLFMTIGFLFVIWVEEISAMRHSSFKVGVLQLSILSLAIVMGMVYKRDSWCRFICPLGALISTCAMASIVEVRSNPNVCHNQCTTHDCYKGRDDIQGCPMFQHLMYVDNNQTCKICLNCVRSCTHDNISLNIRPPATEIYNSNHLNKGLFLFVIALMGILIPILLMHNQIISHNIISFTMFYILAPAILLLILWAITEWGFKSQAQSGKDVLWRSTYAYVPLVLTAHIAYQLQFLPIVNNFLFSVLLSPSKSANIVIYTQTLFYLFKTVYYLIEFVLFFKIIAYVILTFKKIDLKERKSSLIKPILSSFIVGIAIYYIFDKVNHYIFSMVRPVVESTNFVYSIPLFHVFQLIILVFGIILSFFCMFRIMKNYRESNLKSHKILLASHFLFMVCYSLLVFVLLVV